MNRFIEFHDGRSFDVVVVGGGISGAAVAYDAASRGLSVALVEKDDFGCATSAATSKLIHGGSRYLATYEFALVRESLRERRALLNIAPNLVYPHPVIVALYEDGAKPWMIRIGMVLYDLLSFDKAFTWDPSKRLPIHRMLSAAEALRLEPNFKADGLKGASLFYDCANLCPERLTLAFVKSAVKAGAQAANYAKATGFLLAGGKRVCGVRVKDLLHDTEVEIEGRLVVNCAGPWADVVLGFAQGQGGEAKVRRSEGIHVVTRKIAGDHMYAYGATSGRAVFVRPWRGRSLIGTTDKEYVGDPDNWRVTRAAIEELLADANDRLRVGPVRYEDVLYTYGGLRPLVDDQSKGTRETSRRYEIYDNAENGIDGLLTVLGGKYTTSRGLAENVMKLVGTKLGRDLGRSTTASRRLAGCEIDDVEAFLATVRHGSDGLQENTLDWLGRHYGTEWRAVADIAAAGKALAEPLDVDGEIAAQAVYAVRHEMARTLKDVFFRRTGLGTAGDPGEPVVERVARLCADELGWDEPRRQAEVAKVQRALQLPA